MKITAEPRSDQWNADDFVGGPRTFEIVGVVVGKAEQKYDIQLAGSDRVWRPPLTVLRLLITAWGNDAETWVGRRVTLYRDDSVKFGRDQVGGIRVSHLSHIDKPLTVSLTESRGKRAKLTVQPLADAAPRPDYATQVGAATTRDDLNRVWATAIGAGDLDEPLQQAMKDRAAQIAADEQPADGA